MKPEPTRHAIGDWFGDIPGSQQACERAVADTKTRCELNPGQCENAALPMELAMKRCRRQTREGGHEASLLS
jgi:hypothetical protein